MPIYEKLIIITKKTALEELIERFNTREQARFYIEHMGASFVEYEAAHEAYRGALRAVKGALPRAALTDGQTLYAVNDLFIGRRTHVSARYRLRLADREEDQSSSGIIISTGAGSTGWLRSVLAGAAGVMGRLAPSEAVEAAREQYRFDWE